MEEGAVHKSLARLRLAASGLKSVSPLPFLVHSDPSILEIENLVLLSTRRRRGLEHSVRQLRPLIEWRKQREKWQQLVQGIPRLSEISSPPLPAPASFLSPFSV